MAEIMIEHAGVSKFVTANGNGRLDAVSNAIKQYFGISYELAVYEEHALTQGSSSKAAAYVGICCHDSLYWGVGFDEDIIKASIAAIVTAVNKLAEIKEIHEVKDERMLEILNHIQTNFMTITLYDLSEKFNLSTQYLSKYIKDKSGMTFGDNVKKIRMKKARTLLKNGNMTVDCVADAVGWQNVEHFTRIFKKTYGMTPVQFRREKQ